MSLEQKPPLDELYLAHFGIKGMKWGFRKERSKSSDVASVSRDNAGGLHITQSQKRKAIAAAGVLAVGSALYATGNLKAASIGGTKLAARGAVAATKIVAKVSIYTVKTAAQTVGVILGTTAKGVGNIASKTVETVANSGRDPASSVLKRTGRQKISDLASKLKPWRKRGENPAADVLKRSGRQRLSSLVTKLRPNRTPKPPTQLFPTPKMNIFGRIRGDAKVTDLSGATNGVMSWTDRALGRGR